MDYTEKQETEISIRKLFFYVFYKWRSILLTAMMFCILAGAYKFTMDKLETAGEGGMPKAEREYKIALEVYKLTKASYNRNISYYQKRLEQQEIYMEESVLMQVNPYEKPDASADIFVKLEDSEWQSLPDNINIDPTDSLIQIYTSNFLSIVDWEPVEALTGKSKLYLKELVSVGADYNSNTFTISVTYNDGDTARQILNLLTEQILTRYQNMDANINQHSIAIVSSSLTYSIDNSLAEIQQSNADIVTSYEQNILDFQKMIEDLKKPSRPLGAAKYCVIGFVGGAALMVFVYIAVYLFGGTLRGEDDIKNKYGYYLLGVIPNTTGKKGLPGIDRLIGRLEGNPIHGTAEDAYHFIAANTAALTGSNKKLLVTGNVDFHRLQELVSNIAPLLEDRTLTASSSLLLAPDTIKELSKCDAVILAEERNKSRIRDLQKEQESILALDKPVIGYVLF